MKIDDIIRASLKALEEGEARKTNTNIVTRGALVLPADLLCEEFAEALPSEAPTESSSPDKPDGGSLYAAQDAAWVGALQLRMTVGPRHTKHRSKHWERICKEMACELDSSNTAAIFELSSQKLKSVFFQEEYERLFSSAIVNAAVTGLALRLCVEQPLSPALREQEMAKESVEEFSLFFAGMYCFVSIIPQQDVALVLIMNERTQQGRSWFVLRETTRRLLEGEIVGAY